MGAAAPWSVKGIDPRAREVAKELARRSGMTLGEWLNRIILEDDMPEEIASEEQITARLPRALYETPPAPMPVASSATSKSEERGLDDLGRIAQALDRLTDRIEASETRTGLAISGVEHSVRHAMARIETAEREQIAVATRFDAAAERLEAEQARATERLRQIENEGPRSAEALRALEARLVRAETSDPAELIEDVVTRLGERLADAESRTSASLQSLRGSLAELDERLISSGGSRTEFERRLEELAHELTRRIDDARTELAAQLATGSTVPVQVEARLERLAIDLAAAEQRSARAIETMGREVLTMADTLNRRVRSAEQRSAEAIEQVGGEIARIAGAVETRLERTDQLHAEALERLGAEIGRITERLTDRILQSERRAAQAIDDVGEQVAKVTERIEQRHERASSDLAERIRASEARTAKLLEEARARLTAFDSEEPDADEPVQDMEAAPEAPTPERTLPPIFAAELFSRAEPIAQPALDPANPLFGAEDFEAADGFVPLEEPAEEERIEPEAVQSERPASPQLSTREVIEQARAAARAAAASATRPATIHAGERRARPARGHGLLSGLKTSRAPSTWQTALMVAGGAAFLSVGAAGVVLMEGPGVPRQPEPAHQIDIPPRAAMALTGGSTAPEPAATVLPGDPAGDAATAAYLAAVRGVDRREPGALAKLKTIADGGYAPAQVYLARLYETGQGGAVVNLAEARRWTERAAEAGDPAAMHNLALFYFRGEGGPSDAAAAGRWFRSAAQHGVVDSQYNLGLLYQSGSGVPKDLAQAYKWFSIAAIAGDAQARAAAVDLQDKLQTARRAAMDGEVAVFEPQAGAATARPASAAAPAPTEAQRVLARLGYYKGRAEAADPKALKVAVAAYQRDQGLAATGSLDPATVSRLSVFTR
jgi:localization factor PodJL